MTASDAPLLVVVGPTASGKTEFAVRLAEASGGEIISADSVQVYRHFNIGSGKPSQEELSRAHHHLIDVVEPSAPMDAVRWADLATQALEDLRTRQVVPIICGGSFLFVRALLYGLAPAPPADEAVRTRHKAWAEKEGRAALHEHLMRVDPERGKELNANDFVRVSRALEILELSGKPMSAWQAEHGFREVRHQARLVGLERAREELDERIHRRVRAMFASGWINEVDELLTAGHGDCRAMGAVGYRLIAERLRPPGEAPLRPADLSAEQRTELEQAVYRATRVFARRQMTWLRDEPVTWLSEADAAEYRL